MIPFYKKALGRLYLSCPNNLYRKAMGDRTNRKIKLLKTRLMPQPSALVKVLQTKSTKLTTDLNSKLKKTHAIVAPMRTCLG